MSNTKTSLADKLREATTVLDEEYHRSISEILMKAANELERLHRQVLTLRVEKDILQDEVQSWAETL